MKPKFKVGDMVDFEGLTGEIIGIFDCDNDFGWTPSYRIRVPSSAMLGGFSIFHRVEEDLTLHDELVS